MPSSTMKNGMAPPQQNVSSNKEYSPNHTTPEHAAPSTPPPTTPNRDENSAPLSSARDPRRTPLLSRIPFGPTPNSKITGGGVTASGRVKKDITPAYAYKNAETGLLEIRSVIPPSLSMVGNEDDSVVGLDEDEKKDGTRVALYPIALNGGGAGLYRDPREFASTNNIGGFSRNHRIDGSRRAPLKSHVRFAGPNERRKAESGDVTQDAELDLESGLRNVFSNDNNNDGSYRPRQSFGALVTAVNPWKIWEHIHNEMSRVAAVRTRQAEDDASDVILARQKNKAARVSSIYNDDDFDFVLVLAPQNAYEYWAYHLDFREEALHFVDDPGLDLDVDDVEPDDDSTIATNKEATNENTPVSIAKNTPHTPIDRSGLRRRKKTTPSSDNIHYSTNSNAKRSTLHSPSFRHPSHTSPYRIRTTEKMSSRVFQQRKSLFERAIDQFSPTRNVEESATKSTRNITKIDESMTSDNEDSVFPTPSSDTKKSSISPHIPRRRWGNAYYDKNRLSTPNIMSPPVVSLKKGNSIRKNGKSSQKKRHGGSALFQNLTPGAWKEHSKAPGSASRYGRSLGDDEKEPETEATHSAAKSNKRTRDASDVDATNNGEQEAIVLPSPAVPRGIATRVNELGEFLVALKIGIVVRRHCPRTHGAFVKLFSNDGGDTIEFQYVPDDEAVIALKEQEQRYNDSRRRKKKARLSFGECDTRRWSGDSDTLNQNDNIDSIIPIPDYVKAKIDREEDNRKKGGLKNALSFEYSNWKHTGMMEASDIVQVHRAIHVDPFSRTEKLGTPSLRLSQTKYVKSNTLSVILPSVQGKLYKNRFSKKTDLTEKWCNGAGHQSLYNSFDFETATEGEFWMVFRGFLLLHRDASTGRFAAQRGGGFGSYHRHAEGIITQEDGLIERNLVEALPHRQTKNISMVQTFQKMGGKEDPKEVAIVAHPTAAPPPDYFLGYSSPGTQIWGRLRQAGLETQRLHALDTRKVMIKVRCPIDRLQDVAEALKLKLKTKDGDYAPFREDMIALFESTEDGFVSSENGHERAASLFRSSERQKIIDFIIGSRIRDSGAELGPSTKLGKQIQRRVPLHSHARLEALYNCWVLYWDRSNWSHHDGKIPQVGPSKSSTSKEDKSIEFDDSSSLKSSPQQDRIPSFLHRFIVGGFYQPLDSIEEYYGEKIAFYFAWLEHVSWHLLYLSFVGLIVFLCQLITGNWDHPLRPFFSIFVMIWSFVVMVTWRRRSNALAYQWGTLDFQEEEIARPEFKGTEDRECPITKTYVAYYPPWKRWLKMCISIPLTVGFTIITLIGILILYGNRDVKLAQYFANDGSYHSSLSMDAIGQMAPILAVEINKDHLRDPDFWLIIIGFPTALGLVLPLLNFCLRRISLWLNELENHRTEAEFRTHFIIKVFAFRFVCYFAALYYYSFIGVGVNDPDATKHSIVRVASTLFTYITITHWWNLCINIFFPLLLYRWRVYCERLRLKNELRHLEMMELELNPSIEHELTAEERLDKKKKLLNKRLLLEHAQVNIWEEMMLPEHDSFTEYLFAVTQFAYVTCFSVILPITPLIVLFNHLLNMRLDGFKLCRGRRRPLALKTGGIGVWNHVLHIVTVIATLTNCSLMALTSSRFSWLADKIGTLGVFALAIGWEHLMLLVKYIMQLTVSRMPPSVQRDIRRKKYDQERKRYLALRAKKARNSSYGTLGKNLSDKSNRHGNHDSKGDEDLKTGVPGKENPVRISTCPPIKESTSGSSHTSTVEAEEANKASINLEEAMKNLPEPPMPNNERAKSSLQKQYASGRRSSRQKVHANSNSKNKGLLSSSAKRHEENVNPNLEEALYTRFPSKESTRRSPLQTRGSTNNPVGQKSKSSFVELVPPPTTNHRYYSPRDVEVGRALQQEEEEVLSPTSTLTSVRLPTPCQLNLESDEDSHSTLSTVKRDVPDGYYHNATAPPMSFDNDDDDLRIHEIYLDDNMEGSESPLFDSPPPNCPKAKWGVHHSLQFNTSERKIKSQYSQTMPDKKKSR